MAIAERICVFRNLRGMTRKAPEKLVGFSANTAGVRLVQYEAGARMPEDDEAASLAAESEISPLALTVPDIDVFDGLMHTLFALEDRIGLGGEADGEAPPCSVRPRRSADRAAACSRLQR